MVVDGNNVVVRAVKAMETSGLSSHGVSTGALFAFIMTLSRYVREVQPTRLVVCFDSGRSAYREALYPAYKANRPSGDGNQPHVDTQAISMAKAFLSLANIHHVSIRDVESDDIIAAYWRAKPLDEKFVIISGDKDFFQLLEPGTVQYRPGPETAPWNTDRVVEKFGCLPQHIGKMMALTGDDSDNVPGVPGFGPKFAVKYLAAHHWSLDALLDAPLPKFAAKVDGYVDRARLNLQLVDLRKDRLGIQVFQPPEFRPTASGMSLFPELIEFLEGYEMNSVKEKLLAGSLWKHPGKRFKITQTTI